MFIKTKKYRDELRTQKKYKVYGAMANLKVISDQLNRYKGSQVTQYGLRTMVLNELECEQFRNWLNEVHDYLASTIEEES